MNHIMGRFQRDSRRQLARAGAIAAGEYISWQLVMMLSTTGRATGARHQYTGAAVPLWRACRPAPKHQFTVHKS